MSRDQTRRAANSIASIEKRPRRSPMSRSQTRVFQQPASSSLEELGSALAVVKTIPDSRFLASVVSILVDPTRDGDTRYDAAAALLKIKRRKLPSGRDVISFASELAELG